jgi:hypothetical protein
MNKERIKQIIQYTLVISAQEDNFHDRSLGPIHFIKYVYLVDMEYAKYHDGKTFTGINWLFHHFGPWSNDVNNAIEPALQAINAVKKTIPSDYSEDDYIRWSLRNDEIAKRTEVEAELSIELTSIIKRYVHKFNSNTSALLCFVYATLPILNAAPGEILDFSVMKHETITITITEEHQVEDSYVPYVERINHEQKKNLQIKMDAVRVAFQEKMKKKRFRYKTPLPKHDAVFEAGVKWLDSLAEHELPKDGITASVDKSVWKSTIRRGE